MIIYSPLDNDRQIDNKLIDTLKIPLALDSENNRLAINLSDGQIEQVVFLLKQTIAFPVKNIQLKLARRSFLISMGIWLATGSVLFVCLLIITMFLGAMMVVEISVVVATLFIISLLFLAVSLILLVYEIFLATRTIHNNEASSEAVFTRLKSPSIPHA